MQTTTVPTTVRTDSTPRTKLIRRLGRSVIVAAATSSTIAVAAVPALAAPTLDRWTPPARTHNAEFVTTDVPWSDGVVTTAVIPAEQLPLSMVVESEVADRLGLDRIRQGIEGWNGIPGSRFGARVAGVVSTGARSAQNDGVHRIFLDGRCQGDELAWGYLNGIRAERRYGTTGSYTVDGDIGVCSRLLNSPGKTASTLRHELGHLLGLGHIDASCRIMSARHDSCESMTAADHNAVRYLYSTLPRVAGPTRTETAARTVYATRPGANAAATVVLADGFGGSALPVAAAAYAGAIDAPLLLGDASCTAGSVGTELRRVARPGATVALVGAAVAGCSADVRSQGYKPVALGDVTAVADQLAAARRSDTVFVVRGPMGDGNLPDGLTAAAAAGRLGAPVLFA
ncbi:MAG: hypothetical protein M3N57_03520, partial [Actinomycetota bacterium]|nr:hypothetical protein [Actinomycetota bacterium]